MLHVTVARTIPENLEWPQIWFIEPKNQLNSTTFQLKGLENPENYTQEIFSLIENAETYFSSNFSLDPEVKATPLKLDIFGLKNGIARCMISQISEVD